MTKFLVHFKVEVEGTVEIEAVDSCQAASLLEKTCRTDDFSKFGPCTNFDTFGSVTEDNVILNPLKCIKYNDRPVECILINPNKTVAFVFLQNMVLSAGVPIWKLRMPPGQQGDTHLIFSREGHRRPLDVESIMYRYCTYPTPRELEFIVKHSDGCLKVSNNNDNVSKSREMGIVLKAPEEEPPPPPPPPPPPADLLKPEVPAKPAKRQMKNPIRKKAR